MAPPKTNIDKQKNAHAPSLWGVGAAVIFGVAMMVALGFYVLGNADEPTAEAVTNANDAGVATEATESGAAATATEQTE